MLFRDTYITNAGTLLLARATAQQGKLIWTKAATSTNENVESYTTSQMNAIDSVTFGTYSSMGSITNAIVSDAQDSVSVFSEVTNEDYNGAARLYGAWAKIEGDESDTLVIVARCGSGVTPTVINPAEQGLVRAFVNFSLKINAQQVTAIEVSEINYYASNAALQAEQAQREIVSGRANRSVTTHSETSTTSGDAQDIYGAKTFHNGIILPKNQTNPSVISVYAGQSTSTEYTDITSGEAGIQLVVNNSSISNDTKVFEVCNNEGSGMFDVRKHDGVYCTYSDESNVSTSYLEYAESPAKGNIIFRSHIYPKDNNVTLGSSTKAWNNAYINNINDYSFSDGTLGTESKPLTFIWTQSMNTGGLVLSGKVWSNLIPASDSITNASLGSSEYAWKNVYSENYYDNNGQGALLRAPGSTTTGTERDVKIGSIVGVYASPSNFGISDLSVTSGKRITVSANSVSLANFTADGAWSTSQYKVPAGTYVCLTGWSLTGVSTYVFVLLQRES